MLKTVKEDPVLGNIFKDLDPGVKNTNLLETFKKDAYSELLQLIEIVLIDRKAKNSTKAERNHL